MGASCTRSLKTARPAFHLFSSVGRPEQLISAQPRLYITTTQQSSRIGPHFPFLGPEPVAQNLRGKKGAATGEGWLLFAPLAPCPCLAAVVDSVHSDSQLVPCPSHNNTIDSSRASGGPKERARRPASKQQAAGASRVALTGTRAARTATGRDHQQRRRAAMFPSSVQRTYGSKKKAVGADAPGSVLKPSQPLDLSVFSPSPSPPKPVAFTSARKKAAAPKAPKADGASAFAVTGTARKTKAPGTASKPFAGSGWASAIKAPAPTAAATGKGKGNGGGGTVIKRRYAGARTPLRPLSKEDLFAAANEPDPLELDEPPPLQLTKPPMPGGEFAVDLGASASSLSSSQGSAGSLSSASSPLLDAGASGGSGGSGGSDQSRRAKRGVPGSPREESTSQAKTTRLFSPVVRVSDVVCVRDSGI